MDNLVKPIQKRAENPLRVALVTSSIRDGSIYQLTKNDRKNGFYFLFEGLEVPFKSIISTNDKLSGIISIFFGTAKNCSSKALGLCQLPEDRVCYALAGERRATLKNNEDGSRGMDSYYKGELASYFWDLFETNKCIRASFIAFLHSKGVKTIRFNLKGDFRHEGDILAIFELAREGFHLVGYTARDDLEALNLLCSEENIFLNGSNRMYTNRFKVTTSLEEFLRASLKCKGSCKDCYKCYSLRGEVITVLLHGSGADSLLNTEENQKFLLKWSSEALPWDLLRDCNFKRAKGLLTCINKHLKDLGVILRFSDHKDLLRFIAKTSPEYGEGGF